MHSNKTKYSICWIFSLVKSRRFTFFNKLRHKKARRFQRTDTCFGGRIGCVHKMYDFKEEKKTCKSLTTPKT